jgi:hypothetical protein
MLIRWVSKRWQIRCLKWGLLATVAAALLPGCQKEPPWKSRAFVERNSSSGVGVVLVPESLWNRLIDPERPLTDLLGNSTNEAQKRTDNDSAVVQTAKETDLKPIAVYLIEQTHGVLGGRNHKIQFGPGGGDLDLRDFVIGDRGAMRVVFEFANAVDPNSKRRVWYLSNARQRRVGSDEVGAGCRAYMDISKIVENSNRNEGLLFAVGDDRHVSAMAGTYFFSVKNGSRVDVARLTIYDSSKRTLLCQAQKPSGDEE